MIKEKSTLLFFTAGLWNFAGFMLLPYSVSVCWIPVFSPAGCGQLLLLLRRSPLLPGARMENNPGMVYISWDFRWQGLRTFMFITAVEGPFSAVAGLSGCSFSRGSWKDWF